MGSQTAGHDWATEPSTGPTVKHGFSFPLPSPYLTKGPCNTYVSEVLRLHPVFGSLLAIDLMKRLKMGCLPYNCKKKKKMQFSSNSSAPNQTAILLNWSHEFMWQRNSLWEQEGYRYLKLSGTDQILIERPKVCKLGVEALRNHSTYRDCIPKIMTEVSVRPSWVTLQSQAGLRCVWGLPRWHQW